MKHNTIFTISLRYGINNTWRNRAVCFRWLSGTRDVRLAGRRRFYKDVGVQAVNPSWSGVDITGNMYQVPGGAGVDGSNSANGISLEKPTADVMRATLDPFKASSWYTVTLDSRPMLTPLGTPLSLPSLPLTLAVAVEWSNQGKHLQPTQMPLTTLCCTAIDQITIPSVRLATVNKLLSYLRTDTVCYWADPTEDRVLYRKQMKEWEGLYDWASHSKTGLRALATDQGQTDDPEIPLLAKASGVGLNIKKAGARGLQHSPQALDLAEAFLLSLDAWRLSAMQAATMEAKSFIIGMAVITGSGSLPSSYPAVNSQLFSPLDRIPFVDDTAKAVAAARVEEECQIESWGLVEGGHDYDRLNCSIQIHSAAVLSSCITAELLRV